MEHSYTQKLIYGLNTALKILNESTNFEPIPYALIASHEDLKDFGNRDKYTIMVHLLKDGFAGISDQVVASQAQYYITVEGIIQINNGGYTKIFDERAKAKLRAKQSHILSLIAVFVSILALALPYYCTSPPSIRVYIVPKHPLCTEKYDKLNKEKEKPMQLQKSIEASQISDSVSSHQKVK